MSGTDYTQTPSLGLYKPIANRAVGTWGDLWNANADALDSAIHFATGGGPYLPLAGGILTGPGGSTVPALTINTSDNGPICNNGLEVIQGYQGGNLGMNGNDTPHTASVRYGPLTFNDHNAMMFSYAPGFRTTGQYNNLESVLTIPALPASSQLTNAFTASVVDYHGHGALASTFYAIAGVSGTGVAGPGQTAVIWAQNSVCTDRNSSNPYPAPLTGVRMQIENDYFVSHPANTIRGTLNVLSALDVYAPGTDGTSGNPHPPLVSSASTNWVAFAAASFGGTNPSAPWDVGFSSGNGAARISYLVGSTVWGPPVTTGNKSQPVQFNYTDNTDGTTQRGVMIYADPTHAGPGGADLRFDSTYASRAHITLDNLAYLKACNADVDSAGPNPATVGLIVLDGQNLLNIGDGVVTTHIRSSFTTTVGATTLPAVAAAFTSVAGGINDVLITGAVAGSAPTISSFHGQLGTDTQIGLRVNAFGNLATLALQTTTGPTTAGGNLTVAKGIGVFNATPPTVKPSFTGAKGGNTALASVIAVLAAAGFGTDTTTA